MKQYITDTILKELQESSGLTQAELAEKITELLFGNVASNVNRSANMMRSKFYICPVCGNIIHCMGEAVIQCHGVQLIPCQPEKADENHTIFIEKIEDEYYVRIDHDMTKEHYISFIAALSGDRIQMVKLYPEGNAEARFQIRGIKKILFYCNRDGLYSINVIKGVHDREAHTL